MQPSPGRSSLATGMLHQELLHGTAVAAGQQQQQQLGYGQAEHAHMLTAIRQPLFIQTPLQVMLESLVEKLQLQANVITGMQEKIDGLERNKLSSSELLSRIQLLENRVDAATAVAGMCADTTSSGDSNGDTSSTPAAATCPASAGAAGGSSGAVRFSPFAQAKFIQQVAALEQQTAALQASSAQLAFRTEQVLLPRLQQCENRLAGVSNLAGALMAVDMLAAEIGITVPHPPLSALTAGLQGLAVETQQQQQLQQQQSGSLSMHGQQQQQGSGNVLTVSRQQLLQQQIDEGKQQLAAVQQHLQKLQQQVDKLGSDAASVQDQQLDVLAGLQDGVSGLSDKLTQQVALLRREFKPALQATELHQLSTAEFTKVQRQVEGLEGRHSLLSKELAAFKAKEFTELSSSLGQLSRRVAKLFGGPGALTETERALAAAQADLRNELNNLSARFAALDAADVAGAAAAQQGGVQATPNTVRSRASQDDMRATINKAVTLAVQAHIGVLSDTAADGSAASRSRCLVCDRTLRDSSPPRCSTAPQQQQNLSDQLLPLFDHFRPATAIAAAQHAAQATMSPSAAAAGGTSNSSSAQHAYAAASSSNSSGRPRTGSPGRSQGGVSGSSSGPVFGPMGPGLQAAQLRQMSAQKAGRLTSAVASSSSNSAAAAAGGCGIAGLMPVGDRGIAVAVAAAAGLQGPGGDGLFVADLVSSNLRVQSAHKVPAAAAAAAASEHVHQVAAAAEEQDDFVQETSFIAAGLSDSGDGYSPQQQQQQQQPTGVKGAAMSPSSRPQTATLGGREGRIGAVRLSTAAAGSRPGSSSSSSPLNKASVGKRTPLLL